MGEIIAAVDISKGRPPKYPWTKADAQTLGFAEHWTDGQPRRLHRQGDFDATLESFRTMVHRKARDLGLRAHTKINEADASIQVQFFPRALGVNVRPV